VKLSRQAGKQKHVNPTQHANTEGSLMQKASAEPSNLSTLSSLLQDAHGPYVKYCLYSGLAKTKNTLYNPITLPTGKL